MKTIFGDPEVEARLYHHYKQFSPYVDEACRRGKISQQPTKKRIQK